MRKLILSITINNKAINEIFKETNCSDYLQERVRVIKYVTDPDPEEETTKEHEYRQLL